jgi:hypothetical protein
VNQGQREGERHIFFDSLGCISKNLPKALTGTQIGRLEGKVVNLGLKIALQKPCFLPGMWVKISYSLEHIYFLMSAYFLSSSGPLEHPDHLLGVTLIFHSSFCLLTEYDSTVERDGTE